MGAGAKDRHRGRRSWSVAAKAAIVAESNVPGAMVNVVAQRHAINPSQLCQWRRDESTSRTVEAPRPAFAPVIIEDRPAAPNLAASAQPETGEIEITRGEVTVRVRGAVDPALLAAVVQALAGLP
jgi:transposase